ncbi:diphosphomevalonate decarboxylase [Tessaracoccus caeni]|uniref:diphosphomevalonate decarboxylase n=1 Tax=Tessaracoccus caeni TaxID=3031239 RepID=UPI0023D9F923|nr:diphosphomevalonate decarboxylase [Tessaracoccus caeni]MDF1488604.1 diphosphomevalonate decarboxylase [Tessaracoccus caeni]
MTRPGTATATAHANIALIKYWGKADDRLILPRTSSLSLTLNELYATTTVRFLDDAHEGDADRATIDGVPVTERALARIVALLDLVRERAGIGAPAEITSLNTVPTAAGLASSASGFAALTGAAAAAAGLSLDPRELSRLARRGSGSASRSIFGGLAIWHAGTDDASSYAEPLGVSADGDDFAAQLAIVVLVLDAGQKAVSSREAMRRTVQTSPEYEPWVRRHADQLAEALDAVAHRDLARLGEVAEANALGMHATMRAATPPVDYLTDASHAALWAVRDARAAGVPAWATMDAGPNVKVLTRADQAEALAARLRERLAPSVPNLRTIVTHAGPALKVI